MNDGFVKLPRDITNWRWFTDANVLKVYIYLLTKAAFKETKWKQLTLKKGQLITGRKKLAEELDLSENKVRAALANLERTGEISIKPTNKYSIITLLDWGKTQGSDYFFTNKPPTNHQQATNKSPQYNKEKKENNVKNKGARVREKKYDYKNGSIDWSQMDLIIN